MNIGYARVSTDDQNEALQVDALKSVGCERIYIEKVSSASKKRPELEKCLDALREGDILTVWRLDRLGRSIKHLIEIGSSLNEQGIGFQSITEHIDTNSPNGKLVFHMFAAFAEFERDLIRERTKEGLKAARARGRKGGRKPALSSDQIKKAKAMLLDPEMTKSEVSKFFGVSRVTLNKALALA